MANWLFKSEPDAFSIRDLASCPAATDGWDGIRNYQARNLMRDAMTIGDRGFFYHSSCTVPGIVGTVTISSAARPDLSALDPASPYHDPKATDDDPRWLLVDVTLDRIFDRVIPLSVLKTVPALADMALLKRGNRLSIQPVTDSEWDTIVAMADHVR